MTRSVIELTTTPEDHRIAHLAAAAIALALIDAAIPLPLPGVKPGLANIVTLIVLARYGWATAAWVSVLRVIAGGLMLAHNIHRLPVIKDEKLVGIVTREDIYGTILKKHLSGNTKKEE